MIEKNAIGAHNRAGRCCCMFFCVVVSDQFLWYTGSLSLSVFSWTLAYERPLAKASGLIQVLEFLPGIIPAFSTEVIK
jgi:hypothetical protein